MPGMMGIIGKGPLDARRQTLDAMLACTLHERSYASGTHVDEALGLWVGWTAHRGSFGDRMPVWNDARDIGLVFAGEEFGDCVASGPHEARDLLRRYETMGPAFLASLNGGFHGLVADLRARRVLLFNDRYGLKRLYYDERPDGLYFASEAKSLLKVLPDRRRLDPHGLGEFFTCGCVLGNRTLFSGVSLLPGGSVWTCAPGAPPQKARYFRKESWEGQERLSADAHYEAFKATFARILPRYFRGSERIALSLTGGLDTRMILAWAPPSPRGLPCFTFGGMYRESADVAIARRVAGICRHPHTVIGVDRGFLSEFPALAARAVHLTDGAMDVSGAVDLYVLRHVREIGGVRLTGNYGSEVLRGNVAFKPMPLHDPVFAPEFARSVAAAAATYADERRGHPLSFIVFKQVPWHHHARFALEASQLTPRSPYLDNDLVALFYRAPADVPGDAGPSLRLVADGHRGLSEIETDRGVGGGPPSLGGRMRRIVQEAGFKAEYVYDQGMPWWLARVDGILRPLRPERVFLGRHKFAHFRIWYRDALARYVKDVLLDPRTLQRSYLSRKGVEAVVHGHATGRRNHTLTIHRLLTTELLQRQLIEGS